MPHPLLKTPTAFWIYAAAALLIRPTALRAQDLASARIGSPIVGLVSTEHRMETEVRAILGVPGSSRLSEPITLPAGVRHIRLAPTQEWGLAEQTGSGSLGIVRFTGMQPGEFLSIAGAMSAPDSIAFSSMGRAAALVSLASGRVQVLGGSGTTPQVAMESQLPDLGRGSLAAVVPSDDATVAAALSSDGRVFLLSPSAVSRLITATAGPAAVCFLPNQTSMVVADSATGAIFVIDSFLQSPIARTVASLPNLSGTRILLQPAGDAKSVFVAAVGGKTAYQVHLSDQSVSTVDVPVQISLLERVRDGDIFLLSANAGDSPWLLMSEGGDLKMGFVQSVGGLRRTAPQRRRSIE
jgi:hypothetical protein